MAVPLLDLNAQNLALEPELKSVFERVLRSGQFILGKEVEVFENAMARKIAARHALGVSSGTDAILLALMALGIKQGDEVICPSFTFFATAGCVARTGATPVFVDSSAETFNIDTAHAAKKITKRTKAIIPVHLFGQSVDMDPIMDIAKEAEIRVIEDAAQSLAAKYRGREVGTMGDFGAFSFFPSKNLGTFGDAGLLVTNNDELAELAAMLRVHGSKPKYHHKHIGGNFRIDALQCALLSTKLARYDRYVEGRTANAAYYAEKLGPLEAGKLVLLPKAAAEHGHTWNQYTVRISGGRRDALKEHLTQRKIGCEIYYPVPLHRQECFAGLKSDDSEFPIANELAAQVLSIPIYPELRREQLDEVIAAIFEFFN